MEPLSSESSTGAVERLLANVSDFAFSAVETCHQLITSLGVMQTIDWTTMLLFFWIIFGLFVYSVGNILVIVIKKRKEIEEKSKSCNNSSICGQSVDNFDKSSVRSDVFADNVTKRSSKTSITKGPDSHCVQWIDNIIQWFYTQNDAIIDKIFDIWLSALNSKAKKLPNDTGFSIEFVQLYRDKSFGPEVTNVFVDKESNENITTKCKILTKGIKLLVKAFRDNEESIQYELQIDRFEGMLKIVCISEEQLFVIRFMERPDFKASLKTLKNIQSSQQLKSDNKISEDSIINAILNTITSTVVDLCLSSHQHFPKFERSDSRLNESTNQRAIERKLFVKVVKANGLTHNRGSPYCVIEVDEPSQRFQTSTIKDTTSPVWNEHFIFNLKEDSNEILFELYDKTNDKFLGLGIVSLDELKSNPSQNQVLTLQSRPLESDRISGTLSVEFLFMEHSSQSDSSSNASPISGSPLNTGIGKVESNLLKPNGNVFKNSNKEVTLILSKDTEDLIENDTILEVIEEQNNTGATLMHANTDLDFLCPKMAQTQDNCSNRNPFVEQIVNNCVNPLTNFKVINKNPFLSENQSMKIDRSVSCDNLSLVIPIIPPIIRLHSIHSSESLLSPPKENIFPFRSDFKGNPFNILKLYRKNFYSLPTHSIPMHLNHLLVDTQELVPALTPFATIPTPTTPIDHNQTQREKQTFFRNNSQINTNPFLKPMSRLLSSASSINSMIGIESSDSNDSSDDTITGYNTKQNRKIVIQLSDIPIEKDLNNRCDKNIFIKNKNGSKKVVKIFSNGFNKKSFKQNKKLENKPNIDPMIDTKNDINKRHIKTNIENLRIGDGMHDSINPFSFVNQNELDFGLTENLNENIANKSNLTIHSTHRASDNGGSEGYGTGRGTPDNPSLNDESVHSSATSTKDEKMNRSRSKEPRSIIKAIRKRLSFSNKNRSKSMEIRTNKESEPTSRDSSVSSNSSRARSMPGSREPSAPKDMAQNSVLRARGEKSKTESYSNISEISGYSTRTYVHEKSTLIVETNQNKQLKHYVIPISLANKSKWRRKGLKLHSYNDHLFVAKHLSGSITCQVCAKLFSRRPGKQGYQCRDCDYMCHKRCHILVENRCTKSTVSSLNLEYVVDPKAKPLDKNQCLIEVNDKPLES